MSDHFDQMEDVDPSSALTYTVRSEEIWLQARKDYLRGDSASTVCRRHGLARSTFRARAARDGWRRADQPDPVRSRHVAVIGDLNEMTFLDFSEMAYLRLQDAIMNGRGTECESWLRLYKALVDTSYDHDPRTGWDRDSSDCLDRSSGGLESGLNP